MTRIAILVLISATLLGCTPGTATAEPIMCEVSHQLTIATGITEQAVAKDAAGDTVGAQQLASEARTRAQQAHDQLQSIKAEEVRTGSTWQTLLQAYVGVGQAANALIPGFDGGPEMATEELAYARPFLQKAAKALPASCTTVDASPGNAEG